MRIKKITIKNGWYWSAGRKYGWTAMYAPEGVGLNRELFDDSDKIHVKVKDQVYELDTQIGLDFIKSRKAHDKIGGNKIGYIPRELMTKIEVC